MTRKQLITSVVGLLLTVALGWYFINKNKSKGIELVEVEKPTLSEPTKIDSSNYWKQYAEDQKELFEVNLQKSKDESAEKQKTINWLAKNRVANNDDLKDDELKASIQASIDSLNKLGY